MLYVWGLMDKLARILAANELYHRHPCLLNGFLHNETQFLKILDKLHRIGASSLALAYFEGEFLWSPNNCHIYLPFAVYADLYDYTETEEGYVIDNGLEAQQKVEIMVQGASSNEETQV